MTIAVRRSYSPWTNAVDRAVGGALYKYNENASRCDLLYSNGELMMLPELKGSSVASLDGDLGGDWAGVYPYLTSPQYLVDKDVPIVMHSFKSTSPKSESRWNVRAPNEIVINDDRRWTVKAQEIPIPVTNRGVNKTFTFVDLGSGQMRTKCGTRNSILDSRGMLSGNYPHALPYGATVAQRLRYTQYTDYHPFVPTFDSEIAGGLVSQLCPWRVDAGPVTTVMAEMNGKTWDVASELGELPETVKMIYDACKKAIRLKKRTQRKVAELAFSDRNSVKIADATASLWMAYRYGLSPIAHSIADALDALKFNNYGLFLTVRKGLKEAYQVGGVNDDLQASVDYHGRAWMKSRFDPDTSSFARGVRLDIAPAVWEVLPLSFITDWFLNVGDVISAATAPDIPRYDQNSYSNKYSVQFQLTLPHSVVVGSIESYQYQKINPIEFIGLSLNPKINLQRKLDAAALSWFAFRSRGNG